MYQSRQSKQSCPPKSIRRSEPDGTAETELQSIAPKKDCCKDKAEKKDKAQAKAEKQAKRAENRQKMIQNRRDYLAKVKNILTPEQYVQFLENKLC